MRILHVTAAYKPAYIYGGPTMSVALLCETLSVASLYIEVFTTTANGETELSVIPNKQVSVDGVLVTYFKRITKDHTHFSPALLKTVWKRSREFDVIHIHAWWNLVSVLSCLIAVIKRVPVVISPRGMLSSYSFSNKSTSVKNVLHKFLGKTLLKKSNIHVTSANENDAVNLLISPLSITTVPNFVKLPPLVHYPKIDGLKEIKLLFFSRIEEKKGLYILLASLKLASIPYHLTIAGTGKKRYIDELKTFIKANLLNDKITWAGFYGDDKFNLLQQHHLLILPSHDENFGNVVIESLSVGTAVLISKNVGLADYVMDNNLGWICETTPASISDNINNIAKTGSADLERIKTVAPSLVRNDFTGNKLVKQYIDLYKKATGNE